LLHETIAVTGDLLVVVDETLETTRISLDTIEITLEGIANTLQTTANTTMSVSVLVGDDLSRVISETQKSLQSTAASAKVVDDFLRMMSAIPLIGPDYSPEESLDVSIQNIGNSLESIPESLVKVKTDMADTSANLETVQTNIKDLKVAITGINTHVDDAKIVISNYSTILDQLDNGLTGIEVNLPNILRMAAYAITGLLVWLLFTQLAMLVQGFELLERAGSRKQKVDQLLEKMEEVQEELEEKIEEAGQDKPE
jgi:prefoldin subunit 5